MEGTQPSAAGGDGAPTAMVAVPGLSGALTQDHSQIARGGVSDPSGLEPHASRPLEALKGLASSVSALVLLLRLAAAALLGGPGRLAVTASGVVDDLEHAV